MESVRQPHCLCQLKLIGEHVIITSPCRLQLLFLYLSNSLIVSHDCTAMVFITTTTIQFWAT